MVLAAFSVIRLAAVDVTAVASAVDMGPIGNSGKIFVKSQKVKIELYWAQNRGKSR